jgi:hypothetical protein
VLKFGILAIRKKDGGDRPRTVIAAEDGTESGTTEFAGSEVDEGQVDSQVGDY